MVRFQDRGVFKLDLGTGENELVNVQSDVVSAGQSHEFADRRSRFGQSNGTDIQRSLADIPAIFPESLTDRIPSQDF